MAEDGGFEGHLVRVAVGEGRGQVLDPGLDGPGHLAVLFESLGAELGPGLALVQGHLIGAAVSLGVEVVPGAFQGVVLLPMVGVVGVVPQDVLPALEPVGEARGQVLEGGGGRHLMAQDAPGGQGQPWNGGGQDGDGQFETGLGHGFLLAEMGSVSRSEASSLRSML